LSEFTEFPFHIDHIIAQKYRGKTISENLALSCFYCNTYKGPNIGGVDLVTEEVTRLFNPRKDFWAEHFEWDGPGLTGITGVGRMTIDVLRINHSDAINMRHFLMLEGVYPTA
jgi:hypothetical protein